MKFTIVYKTYEADLKWLYYSLLSVNKYVKDIYEIIIYYHDECESNLMNMIKRIDNNMHYMHYKHLYRTIPVSYDYHGYIKQMITKCMSYKDVKTEYIIFMDSDTIFIKEYSPLYQMKDDKIIWCYNTYDPENEEICNAFNVWKNAVLNMTKTEMKKYYMGNSFPFIVKRLTLIEADEKFKQINHKSYDEFCIEALNKLYININDDIKSNFYNLASVFEEFEYIGWYADNFTNDYEFRNMNDTIIDLYVKQYWSHGGLSDDIEKEINQILF